MDSFTVPVKLFGGNITPMKYPTIRNTAKRITVPFVISIVILRDFSEIFFHLTQPAIVLHNLEIKYVCQGKSFTFVNYRINISQILLEIMFEKHCQICGMDVKKETAIKRFGKYFCNEDHAQKYSDAQMTRSKEDHERGGGCC